MGIISDIRIDDVRAVRAYYDDDLIWQAGSELPSGYQRCNYLESSVEYESKRTAPFIDTKILPDASYGFKIELIRTAATTNDFNLDGCRIPSGSRFMINQCDSKWGYGFGDFVKTVIGFKPHVKYTVSLNYKNSNKFIVDGNELDITSTFEESIPSTFYLFGQNGAETNSRYAQKIYSASITKGTKIVWNGIPALDADGKPCMYDTVSKTPFYNAGSNEFLYELA